MQRDKAPGPDEFTINFFKSYWTIIKAYIMVVFQSFHSPRMTNLHLLNMASIALISKKDGANRTTYYRPISLIHGMGEMDL